MATNRAKPTRAGGPHAKSTTARSRTSRVTPVPTSLDVTTRDAEGRTPLHLAAFFGYPDMVRTMLAQDAEVDARDNNQRTPGHWPALKGHLEVIKLLVESGADVNARDNEGRTLLRMAVIGRQHAIEEFLRVRGAIL